MSVWPGRRSETESETVFSLHAYIKKISQWTQQFTKLPFEWSPSTFSAYLLAELSEDKIKKILPIKFTYVNQRFRKSKQTIESKALRSIFPKAIEKSFYW